MATQREDEATVVTSPEQFNEAYARACTTINQLQGERVQLQEELRLMMERITLVERRYMKLPHPSRFSGRGRPYIEQFLALIEN